ncbi:hypothetical protein SUGI_0407340 [Cryptomeria japonica]|nr:hypothetical protein SUGI_0407340 [Cryptomeria japonica]
MEPFYRHKRSLEQNGFINNYRVHHLQSSIQRAREIPNADVVIDESQPGWFWVKIQSSCNWYVVRIFGRDLYVCDYPWSLQGNTCKCMLKVAAMQKDVCDGGEVGSCMCIL